MGFLKSLLKNLVLGLSIGATIIGLGGIQSDIATWQALIADIPPQSFFNWICLIIGFFGISAFAYSCRDAWARKILTYFEGIRVWINKKPDNDGSFQDWLRFVLVLSLGAPIVFVVMIVATIPLLLVFSLFKAALGWITGSEIPSSF